MSHPDPCQRTITRALADFNMPSTAETITGVIAKKIPIVNPGQELLQQPWQGPSHIQTSDPLQNPTRSHQKRSRKFKHPIPLKNLACAIGPITRTLAGVITDLMRIPTPDLSSGTLKRATVQVPSSDPLQQPHEGVASQELPQIPISGRSQKLRGSHHKRARSLQ